METIIGDGDPDEEADGEGNDSANPSTSKDELIEKISNLELLLAGREEIIEALKEDLNREKKLNDILIDQIVLLKSFNSKSLPSHPSESSSDTSDDEERSQLSLIPAAQEQRKPPSHNNRDDDDDKSVKSSSSRPLLQVILLKKLILLKMMRMMMMLKKIVNRMQVRKLQKHSRIFTKETLAPQKSFPIF